MAVCACYLNIYHKAEEEDRKEEAGKAWCPRHRLTRLSSHLTSLYNLPTGFKLAVSPAPSSLLLPMPGEKHANVVGTFRQ